MAAKFFFALCSTLALVNTIAACGCGSRGLGSAWSGWNSAAIGGCGLNAGYNNVAVDNGGCLDVISSSTLAPTGVSIVSENSIDGCVEVVGAAPLLAAVAFEGTLPTAGSAGTSYSCGSGNVGISAESLAAAGLGAGAGIYGPGRIGLGSVNAANIAASNYGAANLGAAIAGAEIAGINAGLAASRYGCGNIGCGCGNIYY